MFGVRKTLKTIQLSQSQKSLSIVKIWAWLAVINCVRFGIYLVSKQRPDLYSHITKSYILSGRNGLFYCFCLFFDTSPNCESKKAKGVKRVGRMWDALRGVVYSGLQSQSQYPALYMKMFYCCRHRHVPQSILWLYLDCRSPILYWELFQNTVCAVVHSMYCMEKAK